MQVMPDERRKPTARRRIGATSARLACRLRSNDGRYMRRRAAGASLIKSRMPRIDLHSHSTASDGLLSPRDLIAHALERGVDVLALTDHDDTAGLAEAAEAAHGTALALVNGAELSTSWETHTVHILGLH